MHLLMEYLAKYHSDSLLSFARDEYARRGPGSMVLFLREADLASGTLAPFELVYAAASAISQVPTDSSKYNALVAGTNPEIEFTLFIGIALANSDMCEYGSFKIRPDVPTAGPSKA